MNYIDNGVSEVIKVERIISELELGFKIHYKDYYNRIRKTMVCTIEQVEEYVSLKKTWRE